MIKIGYNQIKTELGIEFEHNLIMEEKIGRLIKGNEVVHHIDLDIMNNGPENLYLCKTRGIHLSIHSQLRKLGEKLIIELFNLRFVKFDRKEELYIIDKEKITNLLNLLEIKKEKFVHLLTISPKEKEKIKKRRQEIIENKLIQEEINKSSKKELFDKMKKIDKKILFKKIKGSE